MKEILLHFQKHDPILYSHIGSYSFPKSNRGVNLFSDLCEIIIGQQLSERVGDVLFARFKSLFGTGEITPLHVRKLDPENIRAIGISRNKAAYILSLAESICSGRLDLLSLHDLPDNDVIAELTNLRGIGKWSAEMFLMFSLNRSDVFSYGDLGLRRAIQKMYNLKKEPTVSQAKIISEKWKPYRTYACRILWNSLVG